MATLIGSILLVALLSLSTATFVEEQAAPAQQCDANGLAKVRVAVTSVKNATGYWATAVKVNHNGNSETYNPNGVKTNWDISVQQTANRCDRYNSVLETIIYLTAPPPTVENYRPPENPWSWNCPQCPDCRCPPTPTCPTTPHVTPEPPSPVPPTNNPVRDGYEHHEGLGYYKFHNKPLTWPEARDKCKSEGAHLVVINSLKEMEIVKAYIGLHPYAPYATSYYFFWVGANKVSNEFTTVLGGKLSETGYERWAVGKPNNPVYAFCLTVDRANTMYSDIVCSWKLAFICERPGYATATTQATAANEL